MLRRLTAEWLDLVHGSPCLEQQCRALSVALAQRQEERRHAVRVRRRSQARAGSDERLDALEVAARGRPCQRREAHVVVRIHTAGLGAALQARTQPIGVAALRRHEHGQSIVLERAGQLVLQGGRRDSPGALAPGAQRPLQGALAVLGARQGQANTLERITKSSRTHS